MFWWSPLADFRWLFISIWKKNITSPELSKYSKRHQKKNLHNVWYSNASLHLYHFCMFLLSGKNRTRCSVSRQLILWHIELHVLTERGVRSLTTAGAQNQSHLLNENGHRLAVCPHEQWRESGTKEEVKGFNKEHSTFNSGMLTIKAKGSLQSGSLV